MLVRICSRFVDLWFQNPQVKVHPVHQFRSWLIELFQVGVPGWRSRLAFQNPFGLLQSGAAVVLGHQSLQQTQFGTGVPVLGLNRFQMAVHSLIRRH